MNIKTILISVLGLQGIISTAEARNLRRADTGTTLPVDEQNQIVDAINAARHKTSPTARNMELVHFDMPLSRALNNFTANIDPNWFFQTEAGPGPALHGTSSWAGFHLMQKSPFKEEFPGYGFVIHDTCRAYKNNVLKIIRFRLRQAHCINFQKCAPDSFNNFASCGAPLVQVPSQPCSWATQYLPRLSIATLSKFACVLFNAHGPNAPKAQDWSFWCYGKVKQPINDQPYEIGKACSNCPDYAPKCVNNLCMPA